MLILLPPSETKRDGGAEGTSLSLALLGFPSLAAPRRAAAADLRRLSGNLDKMAAALKLGPSSRHELLRNRALRSSPTMPALDRYTGVLYDALDAASLSAQEREFAGNTVAIHSALFGLVRAGDPIPAYRLSHDSRLPTLNLKRHWSVPVAAVLASHDGLILDLRSEAYVALGPAPQREGAHFLRVVAEGPDGKKRALNHFNKKGKGEFVRALVRAGIDHPDTDSLLRWAAENGIDLVEGSPGELELTVANAPAQASSLSSSNAGPRSAPRGSR